MAIDYDSGTGLFDKVGKVVKLCNLLEHWETNTGAGHLEKEMQDIEAELEDTKEFDRVARDLLLAKWDSYRSTLASLRLKAVAMVRNLLASELVSQESLSQDGVDFLCKYLRTSMIRDTRKITINVVGTAAFVPGSSVGNWLAVYSLYDTNAEVDTSAQILGDVRANNVRMVCEDTSAGREVFRLYGELGSKGAASPLWYHNVGGDRLNLLRATSSRNLIGNGSFEEGAELAQPPKWTVAVGTWGTHIEYEKTIVWRPSRSLNLSGSSTLLQTIPRDKLKPYTKYYLNFLLRKSAGADGNYEVGIVGGLLSTDAVGALSAADWLVCDGFFNTPVSPVDLTLSIKRTLAAVGSLYVDEIILVEATRSSFGVYMEVVSANSDPEEVLPMLNDVQGIQYTNSYTALFQTFFARYFNILLPTYGAGAVVADGLAG